jgi:N-acetylneuraminic acid mutarotase
MAMKTKSNSRSAFFNPRVVIGFALYAAGLVLAFAPKSSVAAEDNAAAELSPSVSAQAPGRWRATGELVTARAGHTATLLPDGQVLVAGGYEGHVTLASAELYDPATETWTATGSMATARSAHTATLLPNGQVLVAGGYNGNSLASAQLYDPATGVWTATGSMATARYAQTATLLPNGQVLVVGGIHRPNSNHVVKSTELYDPASGRWTATASLSPGRVAHTAILLLNGNVLVSGGISTYGVLAQAALYESAP